ncbi:hypothetical protein LY78DRAFT_425367 [Colletotrichum sublineola]|nr:hypothetical protein LY78DRAFT_425367 [Colletotrichum sublineola]
MRSRASAAVWSSGLATECHLREVAASAATSRKPVDGGVCVCSVLPSPLSRTGSHSDSACKLGIRGRRRATAMACEISGGRLPKPAPPLSCLRGDVCAGDAIYGDLGDGRRALVLTADGVCCPARAAVAVAIALVAGASFVGVCLKICLLRRGPLECRGSRRLKGAGERELRRWIVVYLVLSISQMS